MTTPGEDDDLVTRPITQRTVSAVDASPLHTKAASSVFNTPFRPSTLATETERDDEAEAPAAGEQEPQEHPEPPDEGEPMAKRNGAARARKSSRGSPQLQICSLLLQNALARDAIAASLPDLAPAQISSALHTAKSADRVKWNDAAGVYALTKTGRAWVDASGAGTSEPQPAAEKPARGTAGRKSAAHRRGRSQRAAAQEPTEVDTSPAPGAPRTFRCAVISDGGFWLSKNGVEIDLEPEEHAQMLAYLERMAEDAAA